MAARRVWCLFILLSSCGRLKPDKEADTQVRRFVTAATAGDTQTVRSLSVGGQPSNASRLLRNERGGSAVGGLTFRHGSIKNDSATYFYRIPRSGGSELLTIGLVRQGDRWLVYHLGFVDRI